MTANTARIEILTKEQAATALNMAQRLLAAFDRQVADIGAELDALKNRMVEAWNSADMNDLQQRAAGLALRLDAAPRRRAVLLEAVRQAEIAVTSAQLEAALRDRRILEAQLAAARCDLEALQMQVKTAQAALQVLNGQGFNHQNLLAQARQRLASLGLSEHERNAIEGEVSRLLAEK
jgi:predicted  nucleic acid-binding Zn-ribbon protein